MIPTLPNEKVTSTATKSGWLKMFQPDPPAAVMLTDPEEIKSRYRYWQKRILISTIVGYALFYFVRKNLSMAMPGMEKDLGIGKVHLGLFLTLHGLLYGVSKFVNGFWGDRANARTFMSFGLALSAIFNVLFALISVFFVFDAFNGSSLQSWLLSIFPEKIAPPPELVLVVILMGLTWMINGWVQGMGFPPCARLMTHWFPPKVFATKFAVWNTSHSIGAFLTVVLCGYLVAPRGEMIPGNWRLCFYVPASLAILGAIFLIFALRDTPPSLGLPEVEGTASKKDQQPKVSSLLMKQVFSNRYIWFVSLANFFVYAIRYAVLDWGPTFLSETKGIKLNHAGWMVASFEISGIVGMLLAGWLTDKVFAGRGSRTALFYMFFAGISVLLFWKLPNQSVLLSTALLCCAGFFIYGPQALIGIIAANLATKHAAATAVGLTGIFGYASTILSGWGLGYVVQHYGWSIGFAGLMVCAALGMTMFALAWPAQAHGYGISSEKEETKL